MSIRKLTAIFSETPSPLKKNEEINKKNNQTNKQTNKPTESMLHVNICIRMYTLSVFKISNTNLNIKLALSCKLLNSKVKLWMVDLVETIKMCNAIKMTEITFYSQTNLNYNNLNELF
jgi:hypothetical protein